MTGHDFLRHRGWLALIVLVLLVIVPAEGASQLRGWAGSSLQMVEFRPVEWIGDGYGPLSEERSVAATQDVSVTAWGFGVRGLSVTAYVRSRQSFGSDFAWPRTEDEFDVILGHAQYVRGRLRIRAGRQENRSGLGFASYDGASVRLTGRTGRVEAYGGRSLARGLRDPARDALRGLEDFVPDQSVDLFGGSAGLSVFGLAISARYQREVLRDRSGLSAERGSLDFATSLTWATVSGAIDYDFPFERAGKGHLTVVVPFGPRGWSVEASARRYVPYFSLSTIWGFFEPVEYHEANARVSWSKDESFAAWASGGLRRYGDPSVATVIRALEDHGRRATVGLRWQPHSAIGMDASYGTEWGPGGFLSSADASLAWTPSSSTSFAIHGTSFQQIEQYRLGDGRAIGGGVSANWVLTERLGFSGGASILRHRADEGQAGSPWNQSRAWTSLRVAIGRDPGLRGVR